MRTRNGDNPKSPPAAKKTPPGRKSAAKTPPTPATTAQEPPSEPAVTPKRASSARGKAVKTSDTTTATATAATPVTPVEESKVLADAVGATPATISGTTPGTKTGTKRTVRKVVKRTVIRKKTPGSVKSGDVKIQSAPAAVEKAAVEDSAGKETVKEVKEEFDQSIAEGSVEKEEPIFDNVDMSGKEDKDVAEVEDPVEDVEEDSDVHPYVENVGSSVTQEDAVVIVGEKSLENQQPVMEKGKADEKDTMEIEEKSIEIEEPIMGMKKVDEKENKETDVVESLKVQEASMETEKKDEKEKELTDVVENQETSMKKEKEVEVEEKEGAEVNEDEVEHEYEPVNVVKDINEESSEDEDPEEHLCLSDEEKDKDIGNEAQEADGEDEFVDDKVEEHREGREVLEEEQAELTAAAEERRQRKELEIFVGGLDRDATEEEVKRVFEHAGEVVEVRLHKDHPTNKNKGYAFVRFAKKEQAVRALSEMKNPVIHGKRCGTAPSEDNDTLFLGNICNTWTKEAIRQKLKEYGIGHVERITLVSDPQHEGLSRGFAFLEFSGHPDAMLAYKRLQKPDAIFGHPERTAKVAFAEPLREPDPEVLAQVKSVFVDGLPPHWDEDTVREHFKGYGDIERITLARNMSTAKRKDFGFVDFTSHEAAVACIDGINRKELGDGKIKMRARLSNPQPKTQAVKGGMAGGFRIGHGSGRGFVGGAPIRENFERGRPFYQYGRGQTSRLGFANDYQPVDPYPHFRGRQNFGRGGRWGNFRGPHQSSGEGNVPARFDLERPRHGPIMDRDRGRPMHMRGQPYLPEEEFSGPYAGRHYDDPYYYGDNARGTKRPYFEDQEPDYMEPSRARPRLDYSDPAVSAAGTRYRGGSSGLNSRDNYGYDYDSAAYPSYYGGNRPYSGDRPYGSRYYY